MRRYIATSEISKIYEKVEAVMAVTRVVPPRIRIPTSLVVMVTAVCAMNMPLVTMRVPTQTIVQMTAA